MSELDSFLNKISKQTKFEDIKPQKIVKEKYPSETSKIDGSILFETDNKGKSILDSLDVNLTEEEKKYFSPNTKQDDGIEQLIRTVVKEELNAFFKDKFVLKESGDTETIIFKIGNSVFKGKLELLQ